MFHDSADRAGREAARDRRGVGPQEAQPPAAGDACQEAEAVTEFQPIRDIANASRDTLVRVPAGDPQRRRVSFSAPADWRGPALSFVLLTLRVHLFDDCKLGYIAAGQMKSHRAPLGIV